MSEIFLHLNALTNYQFQVTLLKLFCSNDENMFELPSNSEVLLRRKDAQRLDIRQFVDLFYEGKL